jgi:hypothetical protein
LSGIGLVAKLIGMFGSFPGDSSGGTRIRSNYSASNAEYFGIVLVRPMRATLVFLTLSFTAIAGTLPDDAVLSQRLVGTWRIEKAKLIETWRFLGESEDSRVIQEIVTITSHVLKFRTLSQDGPGRPEGLVLPSGVYTLKRVPDAKLPRDKSA